MSLVLCSSEKEKESSKHKSLFNIGTSAEIVSIKMTGNLIRHSLDTDLEQQIQLEQKEKQKKKEEPDHEQVQDPGHEIHHQVSPKQTMNIDSLPTAEAQPETSRAGLELAYAIDVERIVDSEEPEHDISVVEEERRKVMTTSSRNRPALISVRIHKTPEAELGVCFESVFDEVQIHHISRTGPLGGSPIEPGDRLISLDFHHVTSTWTAAQAAGYLREKTGFLSMLVKTCGGNPNVSEVHVYKTKVDERLGVSFAHDNDGRLRIRKVSGRGLLGDRSLLSSGNYVERLNGVDASRMEVTEAVEMLKASEDLVSIRVKNTDATDISVYDLMSGSFSTRRSSVMTIAADELGLLDLEAGLLDDMVSNVPAAFLSVRILKASRSEQIGITFVNTNGAMLQIEDISEWGLLAKSPLHAGFAILSINNCRCHKWTGEEALKYIQSLVGEVLIVAQDLDGNPGYISVTSHKDSPKGRIGVSFKQGNGPLVIGDVRPDSVFANSTLNEADEVIAINGVSCQLASVADAVHLAQRDPEYVTLLAKQNAKAGLVLSRLSGEDEGEFAVARALGGPSLARKTSIKQFVIIMAIMAFFVFYLPGRPARGSSSTGGVRTPGT